MHHPPLTPEPIRSILPFILVAVGTATLLVLHSDLAHAAIIRVPGDQPTIQAGINAAAVGDEVLVAPGTYIGAENKNLDFHGKDIVVRSESGPATTIIDCQGFGRGFILRSPLSSAAVVEGFTVVHGYSYPGLDGGGAILILGCSPTISNCVFRRNAAEDGSGGGGVACHSSNSTIRDCSFEENWVYGPGGGLVSRMSAPALIGCTFIRNSCAHGGGGAYFEAQVIDDNATISQCTFHGNQSYAGGGLATGQRMLITDSIFTENESYTGGALSASDVSIERCTFSGNVALWAGALSVSMSTIADCKFHLNSASQLGGAVWADRQSSLFQRCIFTENSAPLGGAVATRVPSTFENCTMVRNAAEVGSGVWAESVPPNILNSIIAFGVNGEAFHCGRSVGIVSCCDIYGNDGGDWVGCLKGELGSNGNISANPLFCNLDGGDFSLCGDSPCAPPQSTCGLIGALPEGCGPCGVTAVKPSTWGGIKHHARSLPGAPVLAK